MAILLSMGCDVSHPRGAATTGGAALTSCKGAQSYDGDW